MCLFVKVCFEKRLVVAHELSDGSTAGFAYGDLGAVHAALGNLEQAVSCIDHQITAAR